MLYSKAYKKLKAIFHDVKVLEMNETFFRIGAHVCSLNIQSLNRFHWGQGVQINF
jgi:hypothetical protein